jgi:hypothetical protein
MRTFGVPLCTLLLALALSAQDKYNSPEIAPGELHIPVTLKKGLKVEKLHVGDEVRFRLEGPVLVGKGLVMPDGATLVGRVRLSKQLVGGSPSLLSVIVHEARWKKNTMPLHAVISGLGIRRQVTMGMSPGCDPNATRTERPSRGLGGPTWRRTFGDTMSSADCWMMKDRGESNVADVGLKGISLFRDKNSGVTVLVSNKKNIHLPGGLLMGLRNLPMDEAPEIISKK